MDVLLRLYLVTPILFLAEHTMWPVLISVFRSMTEMRSSRCVVPWFIRQVIAPGGVVELFSMIAGLELGSIIPYALNHRDGAPGRCSSTRSSINSLEAAEHDGRALRLEIKRNLQEAEVGEQLNSVSGSLISWTT